MENIQTALFLLGIGIIMVFMVLSLVVGIGNLLIRLTNRYIKEDGKNGSVVNPGGTNNKKIAAIIAAVDFATQGSGKVDSINKK